MDGLGKSHNCLFCKKSFILKSSLKIHELKHSRQVKNLKHKLKSDLITCRSALEEHKEKLIKCCLKKDSEETHKCIKPHHACTLCDKIFASLKALNFHLKKHSLRKKLKCPNCDKGFPSHKTYAKHTQHGELYGYSCRKKFRCLLCEKIFFSEALLNKHVSQKSFHCGTCIKKFESCSEAEDHKKTHVLKCLVCCEVFSNKNELNRHKLSHDIGELNCSVCSKKFTSLGSLSRHRYRVHMVKKDVQCKYCGKRFHKRTYKAHLRTHTGERPYKCEECNATFVQKNHLVKHMKTHITDKDFKCDLCGITFNTNQCLRFHAKMHTGGRHYSCNICMKSYEDVSSYNEHQLSHHPKECHACKICGKEYSFIHLIYSHYRKHSQEDLQKLDKETLNTIWETKAGNKRKMKCKFCSKIFYIFSGLQEHVQHYHSDEKPHKCSTCGKVFGLKHNLKLHERIHNSEQSLVCKLCGKTFIRSDHAKSHMVVHTQEKPYECNVCGKSFTRKSYFLSHKKIHAVGLQESLSVVMKNYFHCSGCGKGFKVERKYSKHLETCSQIVDVSKVELLNSSSEIFEYMEKKEISDKTFNRNVLFNEMFALECSDIVEIQVPDIECINDVSLDSKEEFMVHIIEETESVFPAM
ncbi:zinc finger protein 678-like isoform X2 [Macrobrachium nipponense]|uniref:zinc finger protein 678-like isoform X2 n=1 Tax=Macrobrachium nipponense TaxID=159736 RepID=UPI0030C7ABC2